MRRRPHALEFALGTGLLLGPLVYALTLEAPPSEPAVCEVTTVYESVIVEVEVCRQAPEPAPEPKPELSAPEQPASALAAMLLVTDGTIVLSTEAAPEWGTGRFYEPPGRSTYRVAKRAAPEQLPAELAAWRDRSFDVYGADGRVCSARLGALHVVRQYDGYGLVDVFGEGWDEFEIAERFGDSRPPAKVWRKTLWDAGPRWLVAEIETEGNCAGALWARDAALPAPTVLQAFAGPHPAAEARLAAFERSDELADMRSEYREWYAALSENDRGLERSWEQMVADAPASVRWWTDGSAVRMLELDFGSEDQICGVGGYDARITALERVENGELIDTELGPDVLSIVDADGDGRWEYVYMYDSWMGPGWRLWVTSESEALTLELHVETDFAYLC